MSPIKLSIKFLFAVTLIGSTANSIAQDQPLSSGDTTKPTLAIPANIAKDCPFTYLVPPLFMKGNGMVGGDGGTETGCSVITYYLIDQNLSPDDATKTIEFHDYKNGLEQVLKTKMDGYVSRGENGDIQLSDDAEFTTCGDKTARHDTIEITGPNWHGWIIESEFTQPKGKHVVSGCPEYTQDYRCINLAIGNDKMSAILKPRCFLRKPDDSLHTELSYDTFIAVVKTIRFKEGQ